jgi:hypothetical protein
MSIFSLTIYRSLRIDAIYNYVCSRLIHRNLKTRASFFLAPKVHWLFPFGRNKQFAGRRSQLEELSTKLGSGDSEDNCQRVAIIGLGGVGKTQIA